MTQNLGNTSIIDSRNGDIYVDNTIADYQKVPPGNGWITGMAVHAGGFGGSTQAQLAIWDITQGSELIWNSTLQTWAVGRSWRTASIDGLRVSLNSVIRFGFWCDPENPAQWSLSNQPGPLSRHFAQTYLGQFGVPTVFDVQQDYDRNLTAYVVFEENSPPLKGVWRPPTPAGLINEPEPVFSGTLPHPGATTGALRAGKVVVDPIEGEAFVQAISNSEHDQIGYAKIADSDALLGPGEVYGPQNSQHTRIAAKATQRIRLSADDIYDYSVRVRVQIRRISDNVMVYDQMFEPSDVDNERGYFERTLTTLTSGQTYAAKFAHQDSWGLWGTWSDETTIQLGAGPGVPAATAPEGKIPSGAGFSYQATYASTNGRNAKEATIEVYNETGGTRLYSSTATLSPQLTPGSLYSRLEFHTDLVAGRAYQWRIRFRDTSNVWGTWSQKILFRVNRAPNAPAGMAPAGGRLVNDSNLRVTLSDPDRDPPVQVDVEVYNVGTGLLLPAFPKQMSISLDGTRASLQVGGSLTFGTAYRWRARAYDGLAWSEWSAFAQFTYASLPTVTLLSPRDGGVRNLVAQGSAEYDPAEVGEFWTEIGRVEGVRYINRIDDGDAAVSRKNQIGIAWEATTDGAPGHYLESPFIDPTETLHHHLTGYFKTKQGTPRSRFTLACFNASNALISEVNPDSLGSLNEATPAAIWSDYGGEIWNTASAQPIRFPTGTTQVKIRWYPSSVIGSSGVVRMDGVALYEAPTNSSTNWLAAQAFWGYIDPDVEFFSTTNDRVWEGNPGNSTSRGPALLIAPSASVEISYVSSQGTPKIDDAILIERWAARESIVDTPPPDEDRDHDKKRRHRRKARRRRRRNRVRRRINHLHNRIDRLQAQGASASGEAGMMAGSSGGPSDAAVTVGGVVYDWLPVYETKYSNAGARTAIPIPSAVVQNEGRYRVTVAVKDNLSQEGISAPVEFDVLYEGAPELPISQVSGDPARGEIVINHARSSLDPTVFSHIEVEITDEDGETWIDIVRDQDSERYIFWAPVNGEEYRFRMRQVQILGTEELESRWQTARGSVNYHPDFFLKSVSDPINLSLPFKVPGGTLPTYTPRRFRAEYLTFESDQPKGATGAPRYEEGSVEMLLEDTPELNADAEQKLVTLDSMLEEMGVFVLLTQHPAEVRFIEIKQDGITYGPTEYEDYRATLAFVETHYLEDYFERGGDPIL